MLCVKTKSRPINSIHLFSPALAHFPIAFIGDEEITSLNFDFRHEVVKQMWAYIKENNLLDPKNKQVSMILTLFIRGK